MAVRKPDQIKSDRALIAAWHYQRFTDDEIADKLFWQTGRQLAARTIRHEIGLIRKQWLEKQEKSYDQTVHEELDRLDVLETEIWRAMRESVGERTRKTVEEVARKIARSGTDTPMSDEERLAEHQQFEMFTARIMTSIEFKDVNPAYFDKIMAVQQERRKLLGLYPSEKSQQNVQINVIKGYHASVSPDAWPEPSQVIDGEFSSQASLTSGQSAD